MEPSPLPPPSCGDGAHCPEWGAPPPDGPGSWEKFPTDVQQKILEGLGTTIAAASAVSRAWARVISADSGACFRPLSYVRAFPAAGGPCASTGRQAHVARARRAGSGLDDWPRLARAAASPAAASSHWRSPGLGGVDVGHRHSVATCGAPQAETEAALLFGGNVSRSVAGRWETDDQLLLVQLPRSVAGPAEEGCWATPLARTPGAPWPPGRWGASLTALQTTSYLLGGWSSEGPTQPVWALRLREACAEWSTVEGPPGQVGPFLTAFHTATALEDGKRLALVGGLGDRGSARGVWLFDSTTGRWSLACDGGPSCAGHAAGCIGSQLAVFGGVERSPQVRLLPSDISSTTTTVFDVRRNQWDTSYRARGSPVARRNPVHAMLGGHLIISGGWDGEEHACLADTWALDVRRGQWKELPCEGTPRLEGHRAVMSGLDMFTFGGHDAPGRYPSRAMSVHALSLGWDSRRAQQCAALGPGEG